MRFYLSHSIRGKYGNDATPTQMMEQCQRAIMIANIIRATFPLIELYVPAEHEDFVQRAYRCGYLTEQQILDVDCMIIDDCEGVLIFAPIDDPLQGGRQIEWEHALAINKSVIIFSEIGQVCEWLQHYLTHV